MARPSTLTHSPIEFDLTAALDHERGCGRADLLQLGPRLEQARQTLIEKAAKDSSHWLHWPRRLLEDHQAKRHRGLLTRWLTAAKHFRHAVDQAIILGSPASIAVLEAMFAACCHPYHNELARGERGGRPRIYFVSTETDNDALQGLFDLVPQGRKLELEEERWGIVAIDDGHESERLTAIFKVFWDALLQTTEPNDEAERTMVAGPADSPLVAFAEQANLPRLPYFSFLPLAGETANGMGETRAEVAGGPTEENPYHPGILLAAAVMNVDVVQFLFGAVTMTDRFRAAPVGDNPALDFAGVTHLLGERRSVRGLAMHCPAGLKPLARWWQSVSTSDEAHQQLLFQWLPRSVRRDRLRVTMPAGEAPSGRKKTLDRYLPDLSAVAADTIRDVRLSNGLPTAVVRLPTVDETTVGQLLQMRMIVEAVQACLLNPEP